jgi:hypothetical protein
MKKQTYISKAGQPNNVFWSTAFTGTPTVTPQNAVVEVEVRDCGCKKINNKILDKHEWELCSLHNHVGRLPLNCIILATEYYA